MSTSRLRILLVEDSLLTAEQSREMIHRRFPSVACWMVATEEDAMQAVSTTRFQVVVLDLQLKEGGSGFNVLRKLAALTPKPFVIVMTNHALPQYRDHALDMGADCFVDKALSFEEIPTLLESHFDAASRPNL